MGSVLLLYLRCMAVSLSGLGMLALYLFSDTFVVQSGSLPHKTRICVFKKANILTEGLIWGKEKSGTPILGVWSMLHIKKPIISSGENGSFYLQIDGSLSSEGAGPPLTQKMSFNELLKF